MFKLTALLILGFALFQTTTLAQREPLKRGEDLEKLAFLIGKWEASGTRASSNGEVRTVGTVEYRWILGGVWLEELVSASPQGIDGTVFSLRVLTYDRGSDAYVGTVLDNLNARTYPVIVKWLDDKTLESVIEVEGKNQKWKTYRIISTLTRISDREVRLVSRESIDGSPPKVIGRHRMRKVFPK